MEPDDLYPTDSSFFLSQEPESQTIGRQKEKANTLQALPILKDVIKRLEERIAFYGSVDAIPDEVKANPTEFLIMHNANQLMRDNLRAEKEWLEGLIEEHAKGR